MQMGIDHPADVRGGVAKLRQRILQLGTPVLPFVLDPVDVLELVVLLVAEPRVDEDQPVVVLDQETPQRQGNAVALVGRDAALPQGLRHDAEHGPAVEALRTALQRVTPEPAHLEGRVHQEGISDCGLRIADLKSGPPIRIPKSAIRNLSRGRSCSSISCSSVSTPRSRARPSSARRTYAVARASPKARWRAGFSIPKNAATWSSPRRRSSGTRRRVRRTVQSGLPPGERGERGGTPAAVHSASRKRQSKRALWATNTLASSACPRPGTTSTKRGRPATMASVIPVRRTTQAGVGGPGSSKDVKPR